MVNKNRAARFFIVGLFLWASHLISVTPAVAADSTNWVKWHAKKTMFLFNDKNPVGINQNISAKLIKNGEQFKLSMSIPLDQFKSGEPDRDSEVTKMLKGDVNKDLIFESQGYSKSDLDAMLKGFSGVVPGKLRLGTEWFDLKFQVKTADSILTGTFESKLSQFGIQPPDVFGGLVVSVEDYIKLSVQLDLKALATRDLK